MTLENTSTALAKMAAGHLDVARELIDGTTGELRGVVGRRHQLEAGPVRTRCSRIMITEKSRRARVRGDG